MAETAHFVAEYMDPASVRRPATDPVSTTWPRCCFNASSEARNV